MNPWIPHLLRASGGGGGPVLPPAGRTMLANLKSSLILDEGTGGPTWSRATKAWGFNELGYLEELASGCAFFGGARLVRNTVRTKSEDFSNAAWTKSNLTVTGTNTLFAQIAPAAQYIYQPSVAGHQLLAGQVVFAVSELSTLLGVQTFCRLVPGTSGFGTGQYRNDFKLVDGSTNVAGCTATAKCCGRYLRRLCMSRYCNCNWRMRRGCLFCGNLSCRSE
jgi:hypothetical protein